MVKWKGSMGTSLSPTPTLSSRKAKAQSPEEWGGQRVAWTSQRGVQALVCLMAEDLTFWSGL
jgi:hypothetical protein